jgi:OmpA-OmpF porin, OOP family
MTYAPPSTTAVGDLRLGADVRLLGAYRTPVTVAAGLQVELPTGSRADFAGDGAVRLALRALAAGELRRFVWAAKVGFLYRAQDTPIDGTPFGSEVFVAASAGFRTAGDRLVAGLELHGATVVTEGDAFLDRRATPLELLLGAHYQAARDLRVGIGVGPGLARAFGTPALRLVASVEWAPPAPSPAVVPPATDRDRDGVFDEEDACPDVPGIRTDDPTTNGCPAAEPAPDPPSDRDGDGIIDEEDACPDQPGIRTDDPATSGCPPPPPDQDGDGVLDAEDACPTVPGQRDPDPARNGCPLVRVDTGQIRILEQIQFKFGSAVILPESAPILQGVVDIMKAHPEITRVTVQGHTDNIGSRAINQRLSTRRARAVMRWLVRQGIAPQRLAFKGFGMDAPIDSNATEEGRQRNRRVEFHIDEQVTP